MRSRRAESTAGEPASSSTFWWRRWIEQSRSPRWTPSPWRSNRTWISTCRAPSTRRSRISRSSPNALAASRRAAARSVGSRSRSRTVRIPLPPPPAAGLTSSGTPIRSAAAVRARVGLVRVVVALRHRDAQLLGEPAGLPPCRPSTGSPRAAARPTSARRRSPPRRTRRSPRGSRTPGGPRRRSPGGRHRPLPVHQAGRSPPDRWWPGRQSGCRGVRTFARCVGRSRRGSR